MTGKALPLRLPRRFQRLGNWSLAAVFIAIILSIPLITVMLSVFYPTEDIWNHLYSTVLPRYLKNTFLLVIGVGILTLVIGVSTAWLVTMCTFPCRRLCELLLLLPLAMPAYVIAYIYGDMFDYAGFFQTNLRELFGWSTKSDYWFPQVRSLSGAIYVLSMVFYPYVYLLSRAAFLEQSVCVLEVSRTLGSNPWKTFFRVAVPLARPAIVTGIILACMETLADYGAVDLLSVDTFTTGIFRTWHGLGSLTAATQLAAMLLSFVLILLTLERVSRGKKRFSQTSTKYRPISRFRLNKLMGSLALVFCFIPIFFGFLLPTIRLLILFFSSEYLQLNNSFFQLSFNTFSMAAITAIISVGLAIIIAWSVRVQPIPLVKIASRFSSLGYAIPGTVVAIGVMVPFGGLDNLVDSWMQESFGISTGLILSGSFLALLFAYLVRFQSISFNTVDSSFNKITTNMENSAQTLGYKSGSVLFNVHIPIAKGSLLTAGLLVFIEVMKELPATLILRPFNFSTLAVRTYELASDERLADAAAPSLAIVIVSLIPVILLSLAISRSRPGGNYND